MSSATIDARPAEPRVRFTGVLRSEWIKARTVRPPVWIAAVTVGGAAVFAGVVPLVAAVTSTTGEDPRAVFLENLGDRPMLQALGYAFVTVQALVALIGVLLVSGERSSGLVDVTLATVPRRTPVIVAKLALSAAIGFMIGLAIAAASLLIAQPVLAGIGLGDSLWTLSGLQVVLGGAVSLALLSTIATAIGSLFSNTAAAAGSVLALLLVVPGVLGLLPVVGGIVQQAMPGSAAMLLFQPADAVGWGTVLTGLLILLGWVAVSAGVAAVSWKKRDV
jgi:ABC-2 type transport system permease protein